MISLFFLGMVVAAAAENKCFLIAISTVGRGQNNGYLAKTVHSIETAINERKWNTSFCADVHLRVVSHTADHHDFEAIRPSDTVSKFDNSATRVFDKHRFDQLPVDDDHNPEIRPGERVRQQSVDMLSLLDNVLFLNYEYYLLTEDDALLCAGALGRIVEDLLFIRQLTGTDWSIFRTSVGFMGILFNRASAHAFRSFLNAYYLIRPPDLLLSEFAHGVWPGSARDWTTVPGHTVQVAEHRSKQYYRNRTEPDIPYFVSKGNRFFHIGALSSLRKRPSIVSKNCGGQLGDLFDPRERYKRQCLLHHFVSPCFMKNWKK